MGYLAVVADEKPTPVKKSAAVKGAKSPKTDSPKIEKRKGLSLFFLFARWWFIH